jgi:hypothetical protein
MSIILEECQKYEIVIFVLRRHFFSERNNSIQNICFILKILLFIFRKYKVKNQGNNCSIYLSDLHKKAVISHCCNNTIFL